MKKTKKYKLIRKLCEIIVDDKDYDVVSVNDTVSIAISIWELLFPKQGWLSDKEDEALCKELIDLYGDND